MSNLSSFYPQPIVAGTTAGTYTEGNDSRVTGALQASALSAGTVTATGSSTSRTLSTRFADIVNVKDYGAVGDGVTSDSTAIQSAFDSCPIGGCIYFPPTTNGYRVNTTVRLWQASGVVNRKKNITLLGHNTKLVRIQPPPPTVNVVAVYSGDTITAIGHDFTENQLIRFSLLNGGTNLNTSTNYYVRQIVGDTFKVSTTSGGGSINFSTPITSGIAAKLNCTAIASTGIFTVVGHQFTENQVVVLRHITGGGGGLLNEGQKYYVRQINGDSFRLAYFNSTPSDAFPSFTNNITSSTLSAVPYPIFWSVNTEGLKFEGLHFDGGQLFTPFAQGTDAATAYVSYLGLLQLENSSGYLSDERCNNIKVQNCSFTNSRQHGISYNTPSVALRGDNFVVDSCFFENLDRAISGNANIPKKTSITNCRLINGLTRQATDSSIWGSGTSQHGTFVSWGFGIGLELIGDLRVDNYNASDPYYATSHQWVIANNIISNWGVQGMEINTCSSVSITGNTIEKTAYGISVAARGRGVTCVGNCFRGNLAYDLEWTVFGGVVTGNVFDGRAIESNTEGRTLCDYAIYLLGPRAYFINNSDAYNADYFGNVISGNIFTSHRYNTIFLRGGDNTSICGNHIHKRSYYANLTIENSNNVIVDGNCFTVKNTDSGATAPSSAILVYGSIGYKNISSITRVGSTATATSIGHGFYSGQSVVISNSDQSEYNGTFVISNTTENTFDYTVSGSPVTPATGSNINVVRESTITTKNITITNNSFDGIWSQHAINFVNDLNNSQYRKANIDNIRIVGNSASSLPNGGIIISNFASGVFTNFYIRENTGGFASANTLNLRVNQNNVKTSTPHSGAPNWTPRWVGDMYYDSGPQILYTAIGSSSSSDWKAIATWNP